MLNRTVNTVLWDRCPGLLHLDSQLPTSHKLNVFHWWKMLSVHLHSDPWLNINNSAFQQDKRDQIALWFWVRNRISSYCVQTNPGASGQTREVNNAPQTDVGEAQKLPGDEYEHCNWLQPPTLEWHREQTNPGECMLSTVCIRHRSSPSPLGIPSNSPGDAWNLR